jgi:hypothetical protein
VYVPLPGLELALKRWWSRWVLRGRTPRAWFSNDEAGWVLQYTARYRFTTVLLFLAFTVVYLVGILDGTIFKTDTLWDIGLIVGSALLWLMFTSFFVTAYIERVVLTSALLIRRSWRGRQEIPWSAVNLVRIDAMDADVKVGIDGGQVIAVSLYLDGLSALVEALQQHARVTLDLSNVVLPD